MRQKPRRGGAYVEFALSLLVLIPLLLGVAGLGISMLRQMQPVQVARDAGHMFARNTDFTLQGNQQILSTIAGPLGLTAGSGALGTAGAGNAVVILSMIQYVDASLCAQDGLAANTASCPNYQQWVFTKQIVVGNRTLDVSNLGTPPSTILVNGQISTDNQCKNPNALVNSTNPWPGKSSPDIALLSGLSVYVSEAAALGFQMPPFSSGTQTYAQLYF